MLFDVRSLGKIKTFLEQHNYTLSVAESVTAGLLQGAFSNEPGAQAFFQGGITAYNVGQKTRHLAVEPLMAMSVNCVGLKVSEQMALGANRLFLSNVAVGITGYCSQVPEKNIKDLFAAMAVAINQDIAYAEILEAPRGKEGFEAQLWYCNQAIRSLADHLGQHNG